MLFWLQFLTLCTERLLPHFVVVLAVAAEQGEAGELLQLLEDCFLPSCEACWTAALLVSVMGRAISI